MDGGEKRFEFYLVEERLRGAGGKPLLVDLGGGLGHYLVASKADLPDIPRLLETCYLGSPIVIDYVTDRPCEGSTTWY